MCGADGVRFRSASEPVRASLVFFHASLGSEIDNAITLLHAAPTRPAPIAVLAVTLRGSRHDIYLFGARTGGIKSRRRAKSSKRTEQLSKGTQAVELPAAAMAPIGCARDPNRGRGRLAFALGY